MCGIFAYVGKGDASKFILEGLEILQNRGYDSVGVATFNSNNEYVLSKYASEKESINQLSQNIDVHKDSHIGISHTRWASHGAKTVKNCHPHFDKKKRFSVVHNGVIENYLEIKSFLLEKGIECLSETDTEVIVQLLSYYADKIGDVSKALEKTLRKLEGTWGLVILDKENPDVIIATRRGSPLLIGIGNEEFFVSSELLAFSRHTLKYIDMINDEIVTIKNNKLSIGNYGERIKISKNTEDILLTPYPYEHWTIKEIKEQERSILSALNNGARIIDNYNVKLGGLDGEKERLLKIKNLVIIGCGTSKNAGDFGSFFLRNIGGFDTVSVVDASEFDEDYLKYPNVGVLALSQSGETQDILRCLKMENNIFSIINRVDSSIARLTNCGVYLNAGREVAVASTKAFTSTVAVLSLVSLWFAQNRNINMESREKLINSLNRLPHCFSQILNSKEIDFNCDRAAEYLSRKDKLFILGKGTASAIAEEGSLKIKEISYLHAEGYPGGALKHGPFALIENETPIIVLLPNDKNRSYMESTINEVKSRGAYVITITDVQGHDFSDLIVRIPNCSSLTPLLCILPLQLIAYKLSILKNINPDKPRNLAKVVTII